MKRIALLIGLIATLGGPALAEEKGAAPAKAPQMTAEQLSKMAEAHQQMAACLRSDRPLSECHEEMMKSCHETMGTSNCPMMGGMGSMGPSNCPMMGGTGSMKQHGRATQQGQAKQ